MHALSPAVSATLGRYANALRMRFGARLAELRRFGSWARGEATQSSDVDVMVSVHGLTDAERVDALNLAYDADAPNDWLVLLSPLVYSTEQAERMRRGGRRLFRDIDTQGIAMLDQVVADSRCEVSQAGTASESAA